MKVHPCLNGSIILARA